MLRISQRVVNMVMVMSPIRFIKSPGERTGSLEKYQAPKQQIERVTSKLPAKTKLAQPFSNLSREDPNQHKGTWHQHKQIVIEYAQGMAREKDDRQNLPDQQDKQATTPLNKTQHIPTALANSAERETKGAGCQVQHAQFSQA